MDLQPNKVDGIIKPITNTRISASEWNQLVGSCMEFITEAGMTPDANDNEQFLNAFKAIAANLALLGANTNLSNLTATGENHFADPNLSNIASAGKGVITNNVMPDFETGVTFNDNTVIQAPYDCVVCWITSASTSNAAYFYISKTGSFSGEEIIFPFYINSDGYGTQNYYIPKGYYFKTSRNFAAGNGSQYFKLKGAN